MPVTMKPVQSGHLAEIGHDADTDTLHIKFKGGAAGTHGNVTAEQFAAFEAAPSIGSAYHAMFRGRSGHPWTPGGKPEGAPHEGHPLAHIEGIDEA